MPTDEQLILLDWNEIYVTDKSGKRYFRTTACLTGTMPEVRNLIRKIPFCSFLDQPTTQVILNGRPYENQTEKTVVADDLSDDELLAALAE